MRDFCHPPEMLIGEGRNPVCRQAVRDSLSIQRTTRRLTRAPLALARTLAHEHALARGLLSFLLGSTHASGDGNPSSNVHSPDNMFPSSCPTAVRCPHSCACCCWQVFCTRIITPGRARRLDVVATPAERSHADFTACSKPVSELSYDEALRMRSALSEQCAATVAAHA